MKASQSKGAKRAIRKIKREARQVHHATKVRTEAIVRVAPAPERAWLLNQEEITILKNSIAKGSSDEELKFCLTVARRYKLDPFKQQIWFVKRWDSGADNGNGGRGAYVWTPQVGINGLLFTAARDHKRDFGSVGLPEFGPMVAITPQLKAPEWANVKVWKKGSSEPTEAQAWWDEYAPADLSKAPFWRKMPRRMIGKCATALAIRQAYPDLGGLYIPEECDRIAEEYTPSGRQIVSADTPSMNAPVIKTLEASVERADESNPYLKAAQEREAEQIAKLKAEGHEIKTKPKKDSSEGQHPAQAITDARSPRPASPTSAETRSTAKADRSVPESSAPKGTIEWHWLGEKDMAYVAGDGLPAMLDTIKANTLATWMPTSKRWVVPVGDAEKVKAICKEGNYNFVEIQDAKVSAETPAPSQAAEQAGPERAQIPSTPLSSQALKLVPASAFITEVSVAANGPDKLPNRLRVKWGGLVLAAFDKKLFEYLRLAQGKEAELILAGNRASIVGIKRIGNRMFDGDGHTPIINNSEDRPANTASLFT